MTQSNPPSTLNIANISQKTQNLGPGERAVVWVKGCPHRCPFCIAPEWQSFEPGRIVSVDDLLNQLLAHPEITGLTFSGGEPMAQAAGLAVLACNARQRRELDIICFTGYRYEQLIKSPQNSGVADLLNQVDVLIDGPYIHALNDGVGLRGSNNQRIIHLTPRLQHHQLERSPRKVTIEINAGEVNMTGIPPRALGTFFQQAFNLPSVLLSEAIK